MKNLISVKATVTLAALTFVILLCFPGQTNCQVKASQKDISDLKQYYLEPVTENGCVYTMLKPEYNFLCEKKKTKGISLVGGLMVCYNEAAENDYIGIIMKTKKGDYMAITVRRSVMEDALNGRVNSEELLNRMRSTTMSKEEIPSLYLALLN